MIKLSLYAMFVEEQEKCELTRLETAPSASFTRSIDAPFSIPAAILQEHDNFLHV
jgi:hypothetical protein